MRTAPIPARRIRPPRNNRASVKLSSGGQYKGGNVVTLKGQRMAITYDRNISSMVAAWLNKLPFKNCMFRRVEFGNWTK